MKTTIDMADPLLRRAKRLAARRGTTLKAVIEDAVRAALEQEETRRGAASVRTHAVDGRGLQPGLSWNDWDTIRSLAYQGRGG